MDICWLRSVRMRSNAIGKAKKFNTKLTVGYQNKKCFVRFWRQIKWWEHGKSTKWSRDSVCFIKAIIPFQKDEVLRTDEAKEKVEYDVCRGKFFSGGQALFDALIRYAFGEVQDLVAIRGNRFGLVISRRQSIVQCCFNISNYSYI